MYKYDRNLSAVRLGSATGLYFHHVALLLSMALFWMLCGSPLFRIFKPHKRIFWLLSAMTTSPEGSRPTSLVAVRVSMLGVAGMRRPDGHDIRLSGTPRRRRSCPVG